MTETTILDLMCAECLKTLNGNAYHKDYQNNVLCSSCADNYYAACAGCSQMIAVDEAVIFISDEKISHLCPGCKSVDKQAEVNFSTREITELVDEYLILHEEEKRIKERMDAIKQILKEVAEARSRDSKSTVSIAGSDGNAGVKYTYRTSFKADAAKVSELQNHLEKEVFAAVFSEKLSFDVNKSNFEKLITTESGLSEDIRREIKEAVKITVNGALGVA